MREAIAARKVSAHALRSSEAGLPTYSTRVQRVNTVPRHHNMWRHARQYGVVCGTGCLTWAVPFGCLVGKHDAASRPGNTLASTVTLTATQRNYFVYLGGFGGEHVVSGLAWNYTAQSACVGPTAMPDSDLHIAAALRPGLVPPLAALRGVAGVVDCKRCGK